LVCSSVIALAGCHLFIPYEPEQSDPEAGAEDQAVAVDADVTHDLPLPPPDLPGPPPDQKKPPADKLKPLPDLGCPPGFTQCGKVCVDVQSDLNNCGMCNKVCKDTNPCTQDKCQGGKCNFPAAPTGSPCSGGKCAKVPNPLCCAGCLYGDECRTGVGNTKCGKGGAKCKSCTKDGLTCNNKVCSCEPNGYCKGCCNTAKTTCIDPVTDSQCGLKGTTCKNCSSQPSNKKCQKSTGKCGLTSSTCSVACSSGCCNSGSCESGYTNGNCGKGGAVCKDCIAMGKATCISGYKCDTTRVCVGIPEPKNTPCTGGGVCCNGVCKNVYACP